MQKFAQWHSDVMDNFNGPKAECHHYSRVVGNTLEVYFLRIATEQEKVLTGKGYAEEVVKTVQLPEPVVTVPMPSQLVSLEYSAGFASDVWAAGVTIEPVRMFASEAKKEVADYIKQAQAFLDGLPS